MGITGGQHRAAGKLRRAIFKLVWSSSIGLPLVVGAASAAIAQVAPSERLSADIPAQPLSQALLALAEQTQLQIIYVSEVVGRQRSRAVPAGTDVRKALSWLLQGSELTFEYLTPNSIRILRVVPSVRSVNMASEELLNEIVVTADRRDETLQNVPITIQVLTHSMLSNLNAATMDDFLSYLPGVTAHGVGPAQNSLFMRGLGSTESGNQATGANGIFPSVAIYLDEQSAQLPGRNLDIYAADMDRIEVLEGPQGTLFGAGAEAGVIRYITNKPKINVTEGSLDARYAVTAHGGPSTAGVGVLNIPLIADRLALRGVIYDDRRGGYIDNIPATFARSASDASIRYAHYIAGEVPPNSVAIDNSALVARNINTLTYKGIRAEALVQINELWSVLIAQSYQSVEANGVFVETVADGFGVRQPDLSTQLFNPSYNHDRFENTALTVNGRWSGLDAIYTGAYSVRNIQQQQDYTNYAHGGAYVDYYQCVNPGPTPATAQCFSPSSYWRDRERNTHQSHEIRVSTPAELRIRALGGLFYEKYVIQDQGDWFYLTALPYFNPIGPPQGYYLLDGKVLSGAEASGTPATFVPGGVTSNNPNLRPPGDAFFNDTTHGYQQEAIFGSVDADLVPHVLTLTAGTRYFRTRSTGAGSVVSSFGCSRLDPTTPNPCLNRDSTDLDALGLRRTYSGFRSRASLSWRAGDEAMLYGAWSQGFRAGGFNRGFANSSDSPFYPGTADYQRQASQNGGWTLPLSYAPDNLTDIEAGWRSNWPAGRLQWNATLYQEDWGRAQGAAVSTEFGASAVVNGGTYRVRGFETSARWQVAEGFSVDAAAAWSHGRLVKEGTFYWANGVPIDFSTLEDANHRKVANLGGEKGSQLAGAPPFQGNMRARYEFDWSSIRVSLQVGAMHQAHSLVGTLNLPDTQHKTAVYDLRPFSIFTGAVGVARDNWAAQVYGDNLGDARTELFAQNYNYVKAVTVSRPRTIGLNVSYKFAGL